jgi:hypothetical protein
MTTTAEIELQIAKLAAEKKVTLTPEFQRIVIELDADCNVIDLYDLKTGLKPMLEKSIRIFINKRAKPEDTVSAAANLINKTKEYDSIRLVDSRRNAR